jgi:hypothetical protein
VCEKLGLESGYAVSSNGGITMHLSSEHEDWYRVIDAVTFNPEKARAPGGDHQMVPRCSRGARRVQHRLRHASVVIHTRRAPRLQRGTIW